MNTNYSKILNFLHKNKFIALLSFSHILFSVALGRMYALAPDEGGYLYTFNNLYGESNDPNPQYGSGWITAPKLFLWVAYLPSKLLTLVGVPDFLAIRFLSIALLIFTVLIILPILNERISEKSVTRRWILVAFFIPSVFLWTSVGLRESFIIFEITCFLVGVNYLFTKSETKGITLLLIGSYGLISTKSYLWACLMLATLISCCIFLFLRVRLNTIIKVLIAGFILPVTLFASTSSVYALSFIFRTNISETGQRSGDSITKVAVDSKGNPINLGIDDSGIDTNIQIDPIKVINFHGDYTLVALHFYLLENPNAMFSRFLDWTNLDDKIDQIWNDKIKLGLIYEDSKVGTDTSSLNGRILTPGKIDNPLTMLWPSFIFLFGPFPFIGDSGLAATIASLESPLWWALYFALVLQFIKFRKSKFSRDPSMILAIIFTLGFIAFSALVEVNLGTSFRHRSVLLTPIIFMFARLSQLSNEKIK